MLGAISYDPVVDIELGPLSVSPHGIGIAAGFLAGARLLLPATRRAGVADDDVYALLTTAAVGAIVGARLAYVVNHPSDFDSVVEAAKVWEGGISLLGGFFGAILATAPGMRRRGLSFWKLMDAAAPGMALGVVVGRVGDLVVADHLGKPTDFFLGYRCPPAGVETAFPCEPGTVVHQTALYDLVLTAVLLAVLLRLRRAHRFDGFLIMVFGAWYGAQRVVEDFLREDVRRLGLTGSQMAALATLAACGAWLAFVRRTPRWGGWDAEGGEPAAPAPPAAPATTGATGATGGTGSEAPPVPSGAALAGSGSTAAAAAGIGRHPEDDARPLPPEPPPPPTTAEAARPGEPPGAPAAGTERDEREE
ncbi:MAG: prolipoprotein diacylglyceryl transferase [Acidimicrobiia bacterium]